MKNLLFLIWLCNVTAFAQATLHTDLLCSESYNNKMAAFNITGKYIITCDHKNMWSVMDIATKKEIQLDADDVTQVRLYKARYGAEFDKRYPIIRDDIKKYGLIKPRIEYLQQWDAGNLMVTYLAPDNGIDWVWGKDTTYHITNQATISKYNIDKGTTTFYKFLAPDSIFLWDAYVYNNRYFAQYSAGKNVIQLAELSLDEQNKTFSVKSKLAVKRPLRYARMKVPSTHEDGYVFRNGLLAFWFDNKLTTLDDMKQVTIPFDDQSPANYDKYFIYDLFADNTYYFILYAEMNQVHAMRFDKQGGNKADVVVASREDVEPNHVKFNMAGNKLIYKPKSQVCIYYKDISF